MFAHFCLDIFTVLFYYLHAFTVDLGRDDAYITFYVFFSLMSDKPAQLTRLLLLLLNFGCVYIKSNIIFYLMVI